MSYLPKATFSAVIASTPLVSIDLVVQNPQGQVLLGRRLNRPAQGCWFVPGGRIVKDETMASALQRLTRDELGVALQLSEGKFLGTFEHFYHDNVFFDEGESANQFSTHYVVLAYRYVLDLPLADLPAEQHGDYCWFDIDEALACDDVHQHTQWYLHPSGEVANADM
ncbi:GDP-mannose mannosyl hydrolase [Aliagarivorans taiwanensis]|uniref:GDP-mannose mannosyl hydrolase n=1 Tax=Aliagarivorans taiwanensis TaxID=561966 RepID=UPI000411968D|nr:GDP-mannose mannosyl hydrolase [Aliagarivorans taiwanensis]